MIGLLKGCKRTELVRALVKAKNAFYDSLEESGYHIGYTPKDMKTGKILKKRDCGFEFECLGEIEILWKIDGKVLDN